MRTKKTTAPQGLDARASANRIVLWAKGSYPYNTVPYNLLAALADGVEKHMEGYGCKDVDISISVESEDEGSKA